MLSHLYDQINKEISENFKTFLFMSKILMSYVIGLAVLIFLPIRSETLVSIASGLVAVADTALGAFLLDLSLYILHRIAAD